MFLSILPLCSMEPMAGGLVQKQVTVPKMRLGTLTFPTASYPCGNYLEDDKATAIPNSRLTPSHRVADMMSIQDQDLGNNDLVDKHS